MPRQAKTPSTPAPNYNRVDIAGRHGITARTVRVLMTRRSGYGVGLKEIQVFRDDD